MKNFKITPLFLFWFSLLLSILYYQVGWKGIFYGIWLVMINLVIQELIWVLYDIKDRKQFGLKLFPTLFWRAILSIGGFLLAFYLLYLLLVI